MSKPEKREVLTIACQSRSHLVVSRGVREEQVEESVDALLGVVLQVSGHGSLVCMNGVGECKSEKKRLIRGKTFYSCRMSQWVVAHVHQLCDKGHMFTSASTFTLSLPHTHLSLHPLLHHWVQSL